MKKLLHFLLFFTGITNAQIVNIPNANFKAKLLSASESNFIASISYDNTSYNSNSLSYSKIDTNNDGQIQYSEAQNIQYLSISNSNISDLTGIEAFVNLKGLRCNNNQITSINLSQNTGLRELHCRNSALLTSLNVSQCPNLGYLDCSYSQISSLDFSQNQYLEILTCNNNLLIQINLTQNLLLSRIYCSSNLLTSINVASNANLEILSLDNNQLTALNVTQNPNLNTIDFNNNQISNINLTNQINLLALSCYNNTLSLLDVSQHANLIALNCGNNNLNVLDLSNNINLQNLSCGENNLSVLDLSNNINLYTLQCRYNNLVVLDLSNNVNLDTLYCTFNPLQSLNIKNGTFETLNFSDNPNLQFICVDDSQLADVQQKIGSYGLTNCTVNSYCSFIPGGNYNTITGAIIYDGNANGCEITDLPQPNIKIDISSGSNQGSAYTNNTGNYSFYTEAGNFTIMPNLENPTWFAITPTSATFPFANDNNNTTTQNFCITPNGIHPDLEIVIVPISPARPGFDAVYKIVYKNKGNQILSGNVNFQYNDANLDFVSTTSVPSSQSTGNLVWNYTNLMPFESRSETVTLNVNSPTETPAVNISDLLNFTVAINPVSGDETISDNNFQYNQTVVGAFDPNDKTCLEGNIVSPTKIGEYLHYNINFENTGTFQAENIVVKDVIDIAKYDITTLQILNSSHTVATRIKGSNVEFIFENINLGASQKGNVVFKIKTKSSLVTGDLVSNKANIYFDYNFPIETNTANSIFQTLSNGDFEIDNSVAVFPNPTKDKINVSATSNIKMIQVYDLQGRLLVTGLYNDPSVTVDLAKYNHGIYLLKISTEEGVGIQKVIKE